MSLQPPRDESLNGLLQGYRIYYRELESETGMGPEAKTLKSPSALRAELTGELCSSPGGGSQESLTCLSVCSMQGMLGNTTEESGDGAGKEQAV